ncbi:MAG: DUF3307 domain-containing protein [Deltaproteobacteria bacterium]|nr:DUF3307 domain-containing protein [Deltaproteobacteria bacterium]
MTVESLISLKLFFALTAAHFCGDVLAYSSFLARTKRSNSAFAKFLGIGIHVTVHGCFVYLWLWFFQVENRALAVSFVVTTHFLIDWSRILVETKWFDAENVRILTRREVFRWLTHRRGNSREIPFFTENHLRKWILVNAGDQALHLLAIIMLTCALARA